MCIVNSQKITVASKCFQQANVKISYHQDMCSISTKITSQQGLKQHKQEILLKCFKQQNSYFSQLHPSAIILCKNLHGNMLLIFIPIIFLRKHHLLIDKQKDPTQSSLLQVYYFFQLEHVNTRSTKLESHFYRFPSSSYAFYKIETILKALIQLHFIHL